MFEKATVSRTTGLFKNTISETNKMCIHSYYVQRFQKLIYLHLLFVRINTLADSQPSNHQFNVIPEHI